MEVKRLIELIKLSGLLNELDLEDYRGHGRLGLNSKDLLGSLVFSELLTPWQADRLLEGRHEGFFLGHFTLLDHLATGTTTSIYLAADQPLDRLVAIKVLSIDRVDDSKHRERFRFQATVGMRFDELAIIKTFAWGQEGPLHFMVQEYVPDGSLAQLVAQQGPLSYRVAVVYIQQAALGLRYLHEQGLLHRDLRPEALLLKGSVIKIVGFEHPIAHDLEEATHALGSAEVGRIADYMAPEQADVDALVDHRADLYSLGCVLYFLLTGEPPFPHGTLAERLVAHRQQLPPDLALHKTYFPPALIHAYEKMLAKDPADRFQSADEVYRALLQVFRPA